jgi:hypothetical protein
VNERGRPNLSSTLSSPPAQLWIIPGWAVLIPHEHELAIPLYRNMWQHVE